MLVRCGCAARTPQSSVRQILRAGNCFLKGSKTGSYLTIEKSEGGTVPVVIWEVTATDEAALDRYEDSPISITSGTLNSSTKASARGSAGR